MRMLHRLVTIALVAIVAGWGAGPARAQSPTIIAGQDFNALSDTATETTDSLPSGSSLTNAGSSNSGGPDLDFQTFWVDTRGETSGPVTTSGDTSDFIGVSSFSGSGAPNVSPGGVVVASGTEHNFQFNDGDGRLDLVFAGVDLSGLTGRTVRFRYWINDTAYEAGDAFFFTLSDGANTQSFLNYGETELEANASADNGTANWQTASVDLDNLISNSGFGETITLTISVDTNAAAETIFVDDVVFSTGDSGEPDALDYSTRFNDPSLYAPDFYRASDHDPLVVGLGLGQAAPSQTRLYLPAIIKGGP